MIVYCFSDFFFFKQKTAYEMRISDWSSDVCSSDLAGVTPSADPGIRQRRHRADLRSERDGAADRAPGFDRPAGVRPVPECAPDPAVRTGADGEIGRASCRERVCQYV